MGWIGYLADLAKLAGFVSAVSLKLLMPGWLLSSKIGVVGNPSRLRIVRVGKRAAGQKPALTGMRSGIGEPWQWQHQVQPTPFELPTMLVAMQTYRGVEE